MRIEGTCGDRKRRIIRERLNKMGRREDKGEGVRKIYSTGRSKKGRGKGESHGGRIRGKEASTNYNDFTRTTKRTSSSYLQFQGYPVQSSSSLFLLHL